MRDWTRWTQKYYEPFSKEDCPHWRYRISLLMQMVEIEGELRRVFCDKGRLERIRSEPDYLGEPQTIQCLFEIIKSDQKNAALLREIRRAEEEVYAYLTGAPGAPLEEELRAYWQCYMDSYTAEIEQGCQRTFYLLSWGDEPPRIYTDIYRLMKAYRDALEESAAGSGTEPDLRIDAYDESDGHWDYYLLPESILPKVVWEVLWKSEEAPLMTPERAERREQLIYGRHFDFENYSGDQLSYFPSITADAVRRLLAEGFLSPERKHEYAPSVLEMLAFCSVGDDEANWYFHDYTVSPLRSDCRVTIEGMGSHAAPPPERREEFIRLHARSDLDAEPGKPCYSWYD